MFVRMYTQYSVVVQAFNKLGPGPFSNETRQFTAEGAPEQPPTDTTCTTLTSQTIRVSWISPPLVSANGIIKGYKVIFGPSETWLGTFYNYVRYKKSTIVVLEPEQSNRRPAINLLLLVALVS